jgi:ubiquinone/menaquinone biosynthesis C-methylase UbiE
MSVSNVEQVVRERYGEGAREPVAELCCPVDYDPKFLAAIPREVLERDYGCGDPSRHLREGEVVLDLGSGTGKICFIAAQVVGPTGSVIGIDMTPDMLEVARKAAPQVAERIGYANVDFRRGRIQDLALDLDRLESQLNRKPITDVEGLLEAQASANALRKTDPLIADECVDVVVSNCVLNLVEDRQKEHLFREIHRVLRNGGRTVISDIVSDEPVPESMLDDPDLWSDCISGAFTESGFLEAFEQAGFYGIRVLERQAGPWRTVNGIEFRSLTVEAFKGKEGPCFEHLQAVIYKGPFKEVVDDDGHRIARGTRYAVCEKSFRLYQQEPYRGLFEYVEPRVEVAAEEAQPFDCSRVTVRQPHETKGEDYRATDESETCCGPGECC